MTDADETGQQLVFRVLLTGSVLVQRRFGLKAWLPIGFLRPGDTMGLPAMLESAHDEIRYTTLAEPAQFAILRRYEFERSLRLAYEKVIQANIAVLRNQPAFAQLTEQTLKQLVSCSRLVTLPPGELLAREGDSTDELFVLKSGVVRLVKSLKTSETFRWPTTKRPEDEEDADSDNVSGRCDVLSSAVDHINVVGRTQGSSLDAYLDAIDLDSEDGKKLEKPKFYREASAINRSRLVVVGEVREGHTFAYDEALSVIKRIAAARTSKTSSTLFKELPPIRRNVTAFCTTSVSVIAMSPIILILFIGHDQLSGFLRSFGTARTAKTLDKQLRQQREWRNYKQQLLQAALDKPSSRLQMVMGPRRLPPPVDGGVDSKFEQRNPARGGDSQRRADGTKRSLLEGLGAVVNGAASAELAAASSDMGTTITENFLQRNYLESAKPRKATRAVEGLPAPQPSLVTRRTSEVGVKSKTLSAFEKRPQTVR